MNLGETLLATCAVILFALVAISVNQAILESSRTSIAAQVVNGGISAGSSVLEDAKRMAFDESTVSDPENFDPESLTAILDLGAETGESYSDFDDIDDFHNYSKSVSAQPAPYLITSRVTYVDSNNLELAAPNRTFFKRMTVTVTSPFMPDTLTLNHLFTHWK